NAKNKLLQARTKRIRPGLDDKILASWNGVMLRGIIDAYISFNDQKFLDLALKNAIFLKANLISGSQILRSYKAGKAVLSGYLDDYAAIINAFKSLYEITFDEQWMELAKELTQYVLTHFLDEEEKLFFYTDDSTEKLIARKKEIFDNVIPSSNALMAENLYELGMLLDHDEWQNLSKQMVRSVKQLIVTEPRFMSTWARLLIKMSHPTSEIAIIGPEAQAFRLGFGQHPHFNAVF